MSSINCGEVPGISPFGVRRSVQRLVAESEQHSWLQQCISFELIENIGITSSPGAGRCIRISTAGTQINTASYRGENFAAVDPLARNLTGQLDWLKTKQPEDRQKFMTDNLMVFDDIHLTIEATNPTGKAGFINSGSDWSLIDVSPVTKINETVVSTSTTLGASVGMFGDVPTVGMDFSTTTSHQWSLPEYELFAMGGLAGSHEPRAVWHVKRSDSTTDPNISRSSFGPHFEVIFGLRPGVLPKRYSSITVMTSLTFIQNSKEITDKLADKISSLPFSGGLNILVGKAIKYFSPQGAGAISSPLLARHFFMMTFIVDWKLGTVRACILDKLSQDKELDSDGDNITPLFPIWNVEDPDKDKQDNFLTEEDARQLLTPEIEKEEVYTDLRLEFREGSAVGITNPGNVLHKTAGTTGNYDILFPINVLAGYSETFSIYKGYPKPEIINNPQWLPFKRAARISVAETTAYDGHGLIWTAPHGYSRDSVWVRGDTADSGGFPHTQPYHYGSKYRINLPEVPDSYYRYSYTDQGANQNFVRECIAWRDRIFIIDGNGITEFNSCFSFLMSAIFTEKLSLGIAHGSFVMSADSFRTPISEKDSNQYQTSEKQPLVKLVNDFIYGCTNVWICSIKDQVLIIADDQIAILGSIPEKNKATDIEFMSWQSFVNKYISEENNKKSDTGIAFHYNMLAKVLSRTGIRKPVTGWVAPNLEGWWITAAEEMLFQREF